MPEFELKKFEDFTRLFNLMFGSNYTVTVIGNMTDLRKCTKEVYPEQYFKDIFGEDTNLVCFNSIAFGDYVIKPDRVWILANNKNNPSTFTQYQGFLDLQ